MASIDQTDEEFTDHAALARFLSSRWAPPEGARAIAFGCVGEPAEEADVDFVVGDVGDLSEYDDDSFDLVIDHHCLHTLVEPAEREAFLGAVVRLLRPGGVFFSQTATREGTFDPEALDIDPDTYVNEEGTRIWLSKIELDEELRGANFNIVHTYCHRQDTPYGYTFVNYALAR